MTSAKLHAARCHWIVAVHYQPINQTAVPAADAFSVSTDPARDIISAYNAASVWKTLKPLKNVMPRSTDYRSQGAISTPCCRLARIAARLP
jgi:hypothetical protein